jgi:hypothetical protein
MERGSVSFPSQQVFAKNPSNCDSHQTLNVIAHYTSLHSKYPADTKQIFYVTNKGQKLRCSLPYPFLAPDWFFADVIFPIHGASIQKVEKCSKVKKRSTDSIFDPTVV